MTLTIELKPELEAQLQEESVKKYLAGQVEHHKKYDFKSELLSLLRVHGIEFDEKYVFD